MRRRSLLSLLLPTALLVPAATAAAFTVSGSVGDKRGDAAAPGDLVRASATYKSGGALTAKLELAAYDQAAAAETVVGAFFAKRSKGRCNTAAGTALSFESDTKVAEAGFVPSPGVTPRVMPANGSVKGNTVILKVKAKRFADRRYDCAVVATLDGTGASTAAIDRIDIRLKRKR